MGGMMFPSYVKLGSYYFKLQLVSENVLKDNNGTIGFEDFCIELYKDLPPIMMIETLLHECLHGVLDYVNNTSLLSPLEEEDEELLVETISRATVAGILDNPTLARLIVNTLLTEKKKCEK